ncbi:hypothetical protein [uncultured Chryseobacterium sp.]|uniref:hypothetical protein n=1 Tax=uncultured Chryseobacterium sp. TaxID=259322 RepID=UPI0025D2E18C|nr:hypothetical protein [uncultured Chryseobacterium sp.]
MQFIDFTTDHLTYDETKKKYYVEIPSDQLGDGGIRVQQKQEDGSFAGLECDIEEDFDTVTITMNEPADFRVQF